MNNTIADTKALITDLAPLVKDAQCDVVICTPYTDLATAVEMTKGTNVKVGAENVHWAEKGAFTGEISAKMLVELGVEEQDYFEDIVRPLDFLDLPDTQEVFRGKLREFPLQAERLIYNKN